MQHLSSSGELPHNASCFLHYYDLQLFSGNFSIIRKCQIIDGGSSTPGFNKYNFIGPFKIMLNTIFHFMFYANSKLTSFSINFLIGKCIEEHHLL